MSRQLIARERQGPQRSTRAQGHGFNRLYYELAQYPERYQIAKSAVRRILNQSIHQPIEERTHGKRAQKKKTLFRDSGDDEPSRENIYICRASRRICAQFQFPLCPDYTDGAQV